MFSSVSCRVFPNCTFYVVPELPFNILLETGKLLWEQCDTYSGSLEVDLQESARLGEPGTFKTAHPGWINSTSLTRLHALQGQLVSDNTAIAPFLTKTVCVKQIFKQQKGGLTQMTGMTEMSKIWMEAICLQWGAAALNLVYHFIQREIDLRGAPAFHIPDFRFVRTMMVVCHGETQIKVFLIEEMIDRMTEGPFLKYISNVVPRPSEKLQDNNLERAEFLCFAQHVQWVKTHGEMFTSDFQGKHAI